MGFFGGYLFDGTSWSEFDPAEGFVQVKVARFLKAAGLPAPGGLPC